MPPISAARVDSFLAPFVKSASAKRQTAGKTKGAGPGDATTAVVLSIFDLPPGLLAGTDSDKSQDVSDSFSQAAAEGRIVHPETATASGSQQGARGLTCIRCGLQFGDDRAAQVQHFRSDLHMTNLRRHLAGKPPISQQQLNSEASAADAAGGGDADGHAADGESSSESDEAPGTSDRLLDLENTVEEGDDEGGGLLAAVHGGDSVEGGNERGRVKVDFSLKEGPRLTFVPRGSGWAFSLSSAALGLERGDDPWARLDDLLGDGGGGGNRLWAVMILRSGKFAAAVFEGQSVLYHKVFRR